MNEEEISCDDNRLVAVVKEFTQSLEAGESPSVDEFVGRHAGLGGALRAALEGLLLVRGAHGGGLTTLTRDAEFTARPIGDFQIVGELGRGGMGVVYEAIQLSLGRRVALKVLPFASGVDEVRLQRFHNEAHAAAALHHTNIVPVYAVGCERGIHYFAMQLIDGRTLAEFIDEFRRSRTVAPTSRVSDSAAAQPREELSDSTKNRSTRVVFATHAEKLQHYRMAAKVIHEAALAIDYAHAYGVVHRDIKPGNLMRDRTGKVWVTDFGLAQIESDAATLTRTGDPLGTLRYMSPEQAAGNRTSLDHRTDIYSLGVTLYELLVLQPAFTTSNYRELLNDVVDREPAPPSSVDPRLPIELDTIVRKAMSKTPADRYASARALADDLQSWLDDRPIAARPPTALDRLNKWRRRNSGLVAASGGFLLLTTLALAITTLLIWRQQGITQKALEAETEQRRLAEVNFAQARAAVDAFSQLTEQELAYRPDLQDLRRQFLETSLTFYEDLAAQRTDDPELARQVELTASQVARMVEELRVLANLQPMLQLADPRVRAELGFNSESGSTLASEVERFQLRRRMLATQLVGGLAADNSELSELLVEFDALITSQLSELQINRLRQIHRQRWLPFTFKTREIIAALQLSREQLRNIDRIIEETRPNRGGPRGDLTGRPPELIFPPGAPPVQFDDRPDGVPPIPAFVGPPPGIDRTVREIVKVLTDDQRSRWNALVGPPYSFRE